MSSGSTSSSDLKRSASRSVSFSGDAHDDEHEEVLESSSSERVESALMAVPDVTKTELGELLAEEEGEGPADAEKALEADADDPVAQKIVEESKIALKDPLRRRERFAWYTYDWANSVYSSAGIGGYIPLLLTELAKKAADENCYVKFGGSQLRPATISTSFLSFSVLFQFLSFVIFGAWADYGSMRKVMLGVCAFSGSAFTVAFVAFGSPDTWWLVGVFAIISNVLFGLSLVFYNAYLGIIVRASPKMWIFKGKANEEELSVNEEKISNKYSTCGFFWGYVSGVVLLLITILIAFFVLTPVDQPYKCQQYQTTPIKTPGIWYNIYTNETFMGNSFATSVIVQNIPSPGPTPTLASTSTVNMTGIVVIQEPEFEPLTDSVLAYRINLLLTGIWWAAFTIPVMLFLHNRPSPPIPEDQSLFTVSFVRIYHAFKDMKKFPHVFLMCLSYFVYMDSVSTISTVAVVFASDNFNSSALTLGILLVEVPLVAIGSVYVVEIVRRKFNIATKKMIYFHLSFIIFVCVYVCLGFIPGIQFGLVHEFELFILGAIYGFNLGTLQTYSRSFMSMMIPKGKEAVFFSIYELSDKGSSWIGPLVCAALNEAFGSIRYGMIFIALMTLLSFVPFYFIDLQEAMEHVLMNGKGNTMKDKATKAD